MAHISTKEPVATGAIAAALGKKITGASDAGARLLDRGMLTARAGHVKSSMPGLSTTCSACIQLRERARPTTAPEAAAIDGTSMLVRRAARTQHAKRCSRPRRRSAPSVVSQTREQTRDFDGCDVQRRRAGLVASPTASGLGDP
jgi:hypothetical protein